MSLQKNAVLVKLTISQWDGFKKDARAANRVDQEFKTTGSSGNYNKRLLDKAVLHPIHSISGRIRAEHARLTLPWCYDGVAILPTKLFFTYTEIMRGLTDEFDTAVLNLIQQYPIHKASALLALGDLFNPDDYPDQDALLDRFQVSQRFFPVPESNHFIVDLEAEDSAKMKSTLEKELVATQGVAAEALYSRVREVADRIYERLIEPKAIFRDSLIENALKLTTILPGMNIFNDAFLAQLCSELELWVTQYPPDVLRTDPEIRQQVAEAAFDILVMIDTHRKGS